MDNAQHEHWAKVVLRALVERVKNFDGGDKFITYGNLAHQVNYPGPHTGSNFGREIGGTLGVLGHLIEDEVVDGQKPPLIQAMVVSSNTKPPSDGLKEFNSSYPTLTNEKKRDFTYREFQKVFNFGSRWDEVLKRLGLESSDNKITEKASKKSGLYNPYGSEGSPEHRALRDYIAQNPESIGLPSSAEGITEYPLKSGDSVDVVFVTDEKTIAVEVKSERSGNDDIERGIYQCVKYFAVLKSEGIVKKSACDVEAILVIEGELSASNNRTAKILGVHVYDDFKIA